MIQIIQNIATSILIVFGIFWTLLPCSFGVLNYVSSHNKYLGWLARLCWLILMIAHPVAIYFIWFSDVTYWWLLLLIAAHILFLAVFGRDVSTS